MNPVQNSKWFSMTPPAAIIDDASLATVEIDTIGYDYAEIFVYLGATDIGMTALAVTDSDTAGSGHTNITGLISGTSNNIAGATSTLPSATNDNGCYKFEINLTGKKRYLDLTATVGDGTAGGFYVAWCILTRADESPVTAAQRGNIEILRA